MIDAPIRTDTACLERVEQLVKALEGKGHVVQAGSVAGAEIAALAFARLARCEAAGIEEGDAMVLVDIADERDEVVLMNDFGAQNLAIPLA